MTQPAAPGRPSLDGWPGAPRLFVLADAADHLDAMFGITVGWIAVSVNPRDDLVPAGAKVWRSGLSAWEFIRWPVDRRVFLDTLAAAHREGAMPAEFSVRPMMMRTTSLVRENLDRGQVAWAHLSPTEPRELAEARLASTVPWAWTVGTATESLVAFETLEVRYDAGALSTRNRLLSNAAGLTDVAAPTGLVPLAGTIRYTGEPQLIGFGRRPDPDQISRYEPPRCRRPSR